MATVIAGERVAKKLASAFLHHVRAHQRLKTTRSNFEKNRLLDLPDASAYESRVRHYWQQHYGKPVNPIWHVAIASVTGVRDERFVPHDVWYDEIIPFFNSTNKAHAYRDKNLALLLIAPEREVPSIVKRMHGAYYTNDGRALLRSDAEACLLSHEGDLIIKRSGTDDGRGVRLLRSDGGTLSFEGKPSSLAQLEQFYGPDFAIQERFGQHPAMAAPHPQSLNTVRVVTFRWKGAVRVLLSFVRTGTGGKLTDNAGTGGVCRGVYPDGRLSPTAVDARGKVYAQHPTTGYVFSSDDRVPGYNKLCEYARALHERVFHFDLISWDFIIDEAEEPVFLEMNFRGASYVYQFACAQPIFGDLTEEVLGAVRSHKRA